MSRNVVTTELVADKPVVVVLHHNQYLGRVFAESLATEQVILESYSIAEMLQSGHIQQRLREAYKIAWITGLEFYLENTAEVESATAVLVTHQHKLTILFPVITAFSEEVPGELPYADLLFETQQAGILFFNAYLPGATFLFGQDILSSEIETCLLYLLLQELHKGILYAPAVPLYPQSLASFTQRAQRYFLQPQRSSVLIRGSSVQGSSIAWSIRQLYQSYHFIPIDLQEIRATPTSTLPFSVVENFVTDDVETLITRFTQALPSANSPQKQVVWERLFGAKIPLQDTDYGVEVPSQQPEDSWQPQYEDIRSATDRSSLQESSPKIEAITPVQENLPVMIKDDSSRPAALVQTSHQEATSPQQSERTTSRIAKKPDFDLNQEISQLFSKTHVGYKKTQTKRIQETKRTFTKKTKKRTALFYGGLAFTGMGIGVVCLAIIFLVSVNMLKSALAAFLVQKASAEQATVPDTGQVESINRLKSIVDLQADTYSVVFELPALEDAKELVRLGSSLITVADHSTEADKLAEMLYLQIVGSDTGDVVSTAVNLSDKALVAYESLSSLQEELTSNSLPFEESAELTQALAVYEQDVTTRRSGIQILQQLNPLLSDLLGVSQKRTYALLLQNNQELRPTGGFIEAVAILTFEKGKLTTTRVYSGDEIDKNINGAVVPPEEIKQYLNEGDWNFIDSNWNPNFPETATQVSWFLEKSLGASIDGVAAIDLYGMAKVLEKIGPLDMPQYNEVLTHKNLLDQFEFHSEISLVDQKVDYRTEVFEAFVMKATTLTNGKALALFSALQDAVSKQHLLLSFKTADELNTIKALGWSGSLLKPNCPTQLTADTCFVDTVAQVEANVGVNKANYHLNRSIDHTVALTASQAAHSRKIVFENTAQNDAWPKGPYRVFIRLYVPSSAGAVVVRQDLEVLPASQISIKEDLDRKIIGFYAEVPVKQTKTVTVDYAVPYSVPSQSFSYAFFEQQQPGSGTIPFQLTVKPDQTLKPSIIAPQAQLLNNEVIFSKQDVGHSFFGIKFN